MSKTLSVTSYEKKIKKDSSRKISKSRRENNMVVNVTKTSQKMKQRSLLTIDKNIIE